jgi:hypothetical protein
MSKTFTVTTTELEDKALRWAVRDPEIWLDVVVKNRASAAMTELYSIELKKALVDPNTKTLSSNMEEVVLASTEPTAKQKHEHGVNSIVAPALEASPELMAEYAAKLAAMTTPAHVASTPRDFLGGNL